MRGHKREFKGAFIGLALLLCPLSPAYAGQVITTNCRVVGSNFTTTSGSFVNVTGLSFAAASNKVYEVDVFLKVQTTTSGGLLPTVAFSAAGATGSYVLLATTSSGAVTTNSQVLGTQPSFASGTTPNTDAMVTMKAFVTTGANAGDITVKVLKFSGGTATVFMGSRMTVTDANTASTKNVNNGNESPGVGGSPPTIGEVDLTPATAAAKQANQVLFCLFGMFFVGFIVQRWSP